MGEPTLEFEARELVDRASTLLENLTDNPEHLSEILALAEVAEFSARADRREALAEAWLGLAGALQEGKDSSNLARAWRIHGAFLSESDAPRETYENAWQALQEPLALSADLPLLTVPQGDSIPDTEAQDFLAALEQGEVFQSEIRENEKSDADGFGQSEPVIDADAFLADVEGWLPPLEWPETGVLTEATASCDEREDEAHPMADVTEFDVKSIESREPIEVSTPPPEFEAEEIVPDEVVQAFFEEAREGFSTMEAAVMQWEKSPVDEAEALREVFRLAHGVKGAANSVGWSPLGRVLHHLENALEDQVEGKIAATETKSLSTLVLEVVDELRATIVSGAGSDASWAAETGATLVDRIVAWRRATGFIVKNEPIKVQAEPVSPAPAVTAPRREETSVGEGSTIRVEVERLDGMMNLAGELVVNRHRLNQKLREVNALRTDLGMAHEHFDRLLTEVGPRGSVRSPEDLENDFDSATLARALGEVASDARVLTGQIAQRLGSFSEEAFQFTRLTEELQSEVAQARMVPLEQMLQRLERAVRDAAGVSGKAVDYTAEGGANRLDKLVLDHVFNSLLHLVRNAVAHGIESPADRVAAGKTAVGEVTVRGRSEEGRIILEVSDDGAGLNADKILAAARRRGLVGDEEILSEEALTDLIFSPGLSTAESADSVAGRGVGLDAVRAEVSQLGGSITVRSVAGSGTTFVLSLPLSLAVDRVMLVRCGGHLLAIPLAAVERIVALKSARWESKLGREWLVPAEGSAIKGFRVAQQLGLSDTAPSQAIVVRVGEERFALAIDGIEQERDVVLKPLGEILGRHSCFSGALLTTEGRVVFVADVARLVALPPIILTPKVAATEVNERGDGIACRRRILVVDDSPSLRLLTTRQLEGQGYDVITANDGQQALSRLAEASIDLVITDLEMPRLNGFGLVRKLREDPRWKSFPVVIVTTRDSTEYRETATQLNVLDYLIKPLTVTRLNAVVQRALPAVNEANSKSDDDVSCHRTDVQPRNQL